MNIRKRIIPIAVAATAAFSALPAQAAGTVVLAPYAVSSSVEYGAPYSYKTEHSYVTKVPTIENVFSSKKKKATVRVRFALWGSKNEIQFAKDPGFKKSVKTFTVNLKPSFVLEKVQSSRTSTSSKKTEITSVSIGRRMLDSFRSIPAYRASYSGGKMTVQRGYAYSSFGTNVSKVLDYLSDSLMATSSKTVNLPSNGRWYVRARTEFAVPGYSIRYRTKWSPAKKISVK